MPEEEERATHTEDVTRLAGLLEIAPTEGERAELALDSGEQGLGGLNAARNW
jgi:hypothetical protein